MYDKNVTNRSLLIGNAEDEGKNSHPKGWFVGHFVEGLDCLRNTRKVEVKWGHHQEGDSKIRSVSNQKGSTLSLLITGRFNIDFKELNMSVELKRPGDYVIYAPGVMHCWKAIDESVVVTIRWPSLPYDQNH